MVLLKLTIEEAITLLHPRKITKIGGENDAYTHWKNDEYIYAQS